VSGRTHRQKSKLRLEFVTDQGKLELVTSKDKPGDVTQASINKMINQPAGGFQATLVPRQEYLDALQPGDWCNVYLDSDETDPTKPYMTCNIDRVSKSRTVSDKGALTELIQLSARDYGKVLLGIQLVYDPTISTATTINALTSYMGSFCNNASENDAVSAFKAPGVLIKDLLGLFHDYRNQFVPPDALKLGKDVGKKLEGKVVTSATSKIKALDYTSYVQDGDGQVSFIGMPNLSGNLWQAIEQYANSFINEMFVDTIDGIPCLVFRRHPFSLADFAALASVPVDADEINREDVSCSDDEVMNWFRVGMEGSAGSAPGVDVAVGVGYLNPLSIKRFGVRRYEPHTAVWGTGEALVSESSDGSIGGLLQTYSRLVAEWHYGNESFLSGTMSGRLNAKARPGRRLDYTNQRTGEQFSFYIEGVNHSFSYPQAATTSYTLTRGTPRGGIAGITGSLRFPHLLTLAQLKEKGLLLSIKDMRIEDLKSLYGKDFTDLT